MSQVVQIRFPSGEGSGAAQQPLERVRILSASLLGGFRSFLAPLPPADSDHLYLAPEAPRRVFQDAVSLEGAVKILGSEDASAVQGLTPVIDEVLYWCMGLQETTAGFSSALRLSFPGAYRIGNRAIDLMHDLKGAEQRVESGRIAGSSLCDAEALHLLRQHAALVPHMLRGFIRSSEPLPKVHATKALTLSLGGVLEAAERVFAFSPELEPELLQQVRIAAKLERGLALAGVVQGDALSEAYLLLRLDVDSALAAYSN